MEAAHMLLGLGSDNPEEINSTVLETKNEDKRKRGVTVSGRKKRRLTSKVWVNYDILSDVDEFGNMRCKCKKCGTVYNADSKQGTGNLIRHVKACKMRSYRHVGQMLLEETSTSSQSRLVNKYDAAEFRELLAMAIVQHDLPLQFVEYVGIRKCFSYLHPDFKPITRNTIKADVLKMFEREKHKLKCELIDIPGRISLTSDCCWTSLVTDGYMTLTAHFVDLSWNLQKRILNFSFLPHTGNHLCDHIFTLLKEWGIQKNIFSLTLNNASSNDVFVDNLKGELDLPCEGEFFRVSCCADILNLMVQDGLEEIDSAVVKIRETVKYCKGSQSRKQKFLDCVAHVELDSSKGLKQDVPTRWNSTYLMLESALHFKKALMHFQKVDAGYIHCPTSEEWVRVEKIIRFLKVFYEATLAFSGSANLYFPNVLKVRLLLKREMQSDDCFMRTMAEKMYAKFAKYWSTFSTFMAVAVVLDPRYKLQFVEWGFKKVYGFNEEFDDEFTKVVLKLRHLYSAYASLWRSKQNGTVYVQPETMSKADDDDMDDFDDFTTKKVVQSPKDYLDLYYDDPLLPRSSNIDILQYWRTNEVRFPPVALMARDVLAVRISTVASESAFSIGSRVLDSFRSILKPSTVEALICCRDWIFGEANVDVQFEQLCGDIMNLQVDDEVEDPIVKSSSEG